MKRDFGGQICFKSVRKGGKLNSDMRIGGCFSSGTWVATVTKAGTYSTQFRVRVERWQGP